MVRIQGSARELLEKFIGKLSELGQVMAKDNIRHIERVHLESKTEFKEANNRKSDKLAIKNLEGDLECHSFLKSQLIWALVLI